MRTRIMVIRRVELAILAVALVGCASPSMAPSSPTSIATDTASGPASKPPTPATATPSATATPTANATPLSTDELVVRLETWHELGVGTLVSIHADGRALTTLGGPSEIAERRLTAAGVAKVAELVDSEPLLDTTAEYVPKLLAGNEWPARGGFIRAITVRNDNDLVRVSFVPLSDDERALFEPIPGIDRLVGLAARIEDLDWLLDSDWLDPVGRSYAPEAYSVRLQEAPYRCCEPSLSAANAPILAPLLTGPFEEFDNGARWSCTAVDAATGARMRDELMSVPYPMGGTTSFIVDGHLNDDAASRTYVVTVRALLPDQTGCG